MFLIWKVEVRRGRVSLDGSAESKRQDVDCSQKGLVTLKEGTPVRVYGHKSQRTPTQRWVQ